MLGHRFGAVTGALRVTLNYTLGYDGLLAPHPLYRLYPAAYGLIIVFVVYVYCIVMICLVTEVNKLVQKL